MKFRIPKNEFEDNEVSFTMVKNPENGSVVIFASSVQGRHALLTLTTSGKFSRHVIDDDYNLGFELDENGKIKEC